jgi:hypothetical protein
MSRERRCRGCNEPGHNIRSCINNLDERIILEYSIRDQTVNQIVELPFVINENQINRLFQKYGLASIRTTNNIIQKKERLHNIYLHLGRLHRRNLLESQTRYIQLYRPSYLSQQQQEEQERPSRLLPIYLLNVLTTPIPQQQIAIKNQKPSIQIVVNKNKFPQNTDIIEECPVCYEKCNNGTVTDCNHSYCQPCISNLINTINKNTLPCPLCRENIKNIFVFSENSSDLMLQL